VFGEVHVPEAVWQEVFLPQPPFVAPESPAWVLRHQVAPVAPANHTLSSLDPGEIEAIQLAQFLHAELLLIDEAAGRRVAVSLGLKVTGVVGVLIEARRRGEFPQLRPHLEKLRAAGFWLGDALIENALRLAGETKSP
jgi:predicted nucleic acid-binding protein